MESLYIHTHLYIHTQFVIATRDCFCIMYSSHDQCEISALQLFILPSFLASWQSSHRGIYTQKGFVIGLLPFAITILKFLIIYKQGVPHFDFVVDLTNFVAGPTHMEIYLDSFSKASTLQGVGLGGAVQTELGKASADLIALHTGLHTALAVLQTAAQRSVSSQRSEWGQTRYCSPTSLASKIHAPTHACALDSKPQINEKDLNIGSQLSY